jgi:hypothetical protein
MKAARLPLKVPVPPPTRAQDGKFRQTPGDRLLEAHRKQERDKRGG